MSRHGEQRAQHSEKAGGGDAPRGLVYVSDDLPGISRLRCGKSFSYRAPDGQLMRDADQLQRIRSLAIPPAYTQVWICTLPNGHLQATGRDARGRKQYRYHPTWRLSRDSDKFGRMLEFGRALPRIRARVRRDLAERIGQRPGRDAVLAALVRLLDTTLVRIGNDEYARSNGSYGLTTLRNRHAAVKGSELRLRFRGKSGVAHEVSIDDPKVATIVRRCQAMPGQELFQYEDDEGHTHCVDSADVNAYLREASGADFTAKDFRTWHASAHALALLGSLADQGAASRRVVNEVLAEVAGKLRNTVSVCRKSYVHPGVLDMASAGTLAEVMVRSARRVTGLSAAEGRLIDFLRHEVARQTKHERGSSPARGAASARKAARVQSGAHSQRQAF